MLSIRSLNRIGLPAVLLTVLLCVAAVAEETPAVQEPFAPACSLGTLERYAGMPVAAEELKAYFTCEEPFTVRWLQEPDWNRPGYQAAALLLENGAGQSFVQPVAVNVVPDQKPPVLHGVHRLCVYLDESILYLDGVWAEDEADGAPVITVDASGVNTHKSGTYTVTYTAADRNGNSVTEKTQVVLMEPSYTAEYVYGLADTVLAGITVPGMTKTEKLRAVWEWGYTHIKYGRGVGNKDWRRAAVKGFTEGTGDCFVFYACSRALLDRIGVDYVSIERRGGRNRHYWLLVNVGTGWYHFDTTVAGKHRYRCFMWTDRQCRVQAWYWRYDPALYPTVAAEPFDYDAQVAWEKEQMAAAQTGDTE